MELLQLVYLVPLVPKLFQNSLDSINLFFIERRKIFILLGNCFANFLLFSIGDGIIGDHGHELC
jgi:hypothetical protein